MAKRPITAAKEADKKASDEALKWRRELQQADKREKPWREEAEKIVRRYRGEEKKKNRFNVLWANTEILRPAIYNTKPNPDVRRRFRDADPVGKGVSEVIERALYVICDQDSTETALRNDVLDTLLVGRGVTRTRYKARITTQGEGDDAEEALEGEECENEHVDWQDYREGYARSWEELPWNAFRHKLTRKEAEAKFHKEDIAEVEYSVPSNDDDRHQNETQHETAKVAEFWEVWDKESGRVFFTQENAQTLLFPKENPDGKPPIDFDGFFCCPDPLRIIENTGSRIPIPPFSLYQTQADELDKLSGRIDKIVDKLRLRGIYDATVKEMADLADAQDNELVPAQSAAAWRDAGGLEKAITWMPIEQAAQVLIALNEAREKQKAIIDELTGISDIIRGVTDANETYGAQQLKSNYASVRLQRMQKEVQRYCRDLLRLDAEIVCEKFGTDTLMAMTDLQFPTQAQKQQLLMQAQMSGQPPNPDVVKIPCWEDLLAMMHSDRMRQYRIDIETDSTIAGVLDSDMQGITQVLGAVGTALEQMAPAVQSGSLPVDAAKELIMSIIRRARLGMAVEDAFDKMKMPNPTPPPPDHSIEVAQIKAQSDKDIAQLKGQIDLQNSQAQHQAMAGVESQKQQLEAQRHNMELQTKAQLDIAEKEHANQLEQLKIQAENDRLAMQLENQRLIADATNQTNIIIANLKAEQQAQLESQKQAHELNMAQIQGQQQSEQQDKQLKHEKAQVEAPTAAAYDAVESKFAPVIKELISHLEKPRKITLSNGKQVTIQ